MLRSVPCTAIRYPGDWLPACPPCQLMVWEAMDRYRRRPSSLELKRERKERGQEGEGEI